MAQVVDMTQVSTSVTGTTTHFTDNRFKHKSLRQSQVEQLVLQMTAISTSLHQPQVEQLMLLAKYMSLQQMYVFKSL